MSHASSIQTIQSELRSSFPQRDDAIEATTLALLTGQHAFLLGPPGTGKSALARAVVSHFPGARYFEALLSKSRPDAALLGMYDMNLLRNESKYVRKDEGYLTTVDIAFLDEIGKMSPTSGHDLLAALNERVKHEVNDGLSAHHIPLRTVISASNELPAAESEDAAALWDRLLFRVKVDYIASAEEFTSMLTRPHHTPITQVPYDDFAAIDFEISLVKTPTEILEKIYELRGELATEGFIISDRRWAASIPALRASAWLRGAEVVEAEDLLALRLILWEDVETIQKINRMVAAAVSLESEKLATIEDDIIALEAQLAAIKGRSRNEIIDFMTKEGAAKMKVCRDGLARIGGEGLNSRDTLTVTKLGTRIDAFKAQAKSYLAVPGLDF